MAASGRQRKSGAFLRLFVCLALLMGAVGVPAIAGAAMLPRGLEVVSINPVNGMGGGDSPVISDDGRYVAFEADADLVPEDQDGNISDVYRFDRQTGVMELVTPPADSYVRETGARDPRISDDGRYVAFLTRAALGANDTDSSVDVYIRDMTIPGAYTLVDWGIDATSGQDADYDMSGDGSTIVFDTDVNYLVPGDDGYSGTDVFAINVATGLRTWVSEPTVESDSAAWGGSRLPAISDNGRYVVFLSGKDFVSADTNDGFQAPDWYIRDLAQAGPSAYTLEHVRDYFSLPGNQVQEMEIAGDGSAIAFVAGQYNWNGVHAYYYDGTSYLQVDYGYNYSGYSSRDVSISDDGRFVGFYTRNQLDADDTNGDPDCYLYDVDSDAYVFLNTGTYLGGSEAYDFRMSGDGSVVAFTAGDDLVANDTDYASDAYVMDIPRSVDDTFTTPEDAPLSDNVLANDPLASQLSLPLTLEVTSGPSHGTLDLANDGTVAYTPATNYSGSDSFTYRVWDGIQFWLPATATVTVTAVNDAPDANEDFYSTIMNETLAVAAPGVLANDTDIESDPLTAAKVTSPAHGAVTLNADGSFTYTPAAGYIGADSFTYKANDGTADSVATTVNLTVGSAQVNAVYRFFNVGTGAHLYTASAAERDYVLRAYWSKFIYEGVAYYADPSPTAMPVYRFYNKWSGTHFFTASAEEKARVQALYPTIYTYEGVAYSVSLVAKPGYMPVYRLYNLKTRAHFYTASAAEKDSVMTNYPKTFHYDGIAFYVIP